MRWYIVRISIISILLLLSIVVYPSVSQAGSDTSRYNELQKQIEELTKKLAETRNRAASLSSQIAYMDQKIRIAQLEMEKTEGKIKETKEEILDLTDRIGILEGTLTDVSEVLIDRVVATYKTNTLSPALILFSSSDGFADLVSRAKYLRLVQTHDKKLMFAVQQTKMHFEGQKDLLEKRKEELDNLFTQLETQEKVLGQQRTDRQALLDVTKSDEKNYQRLLAEANAQLAGLRRFVAIQGGASILQDQTKCNDWGCYYNQRDERWGNSRLGESSYSVAGFGCLISSVSMIASHYGKNIIPSDIASNNSAFFLDTGYLLHSFSVSGVSVSITVVSKDLLDGELNAGRPVIAGLYSGPDHFIVILRKEGDTYIMHDPFLENGAEKPLTDKYNLTDISKLELVRFN